jgi:diaminopimelate decarboxylase
MIGAAMSCASEAIPPPLARLLPAGTRVNERGHLEIGGCDTIELAAEFGTPAYVVAEDDLRLRARSYLRELAVRHPDFEVLFACKAFPCTSVCRVFAEEGLACDVASGGELQIALRGGFEAARIYLHGNAKTEEELREALRAGVGHVVLDSRDELERLARIASAAGRRQRVLLRVTPGVRGETHRAISTGQTDSKFGFSFAQARAAIAALARSPSLELVGLHCHIGSQLLELEPFRAAIRRLAELGSFPVYDLGGGLGVAYRTDEEAPSIAAYVQALVETAQAELGERRRLLVEPGRSLVATSTVTLYTVQSVKRNVSTYVAVDGGMSDNLRPMLYGARYEALLASRPLARAGERCRLAGKHCESGDVITCEATLPDPAVGDVVLTPVTGAYGYALASNYNGALRPPVIFCREGRARVAVRRETYADLLARDADQRPGGAGR